MSVRLESLPTRSDVTIVGAGIIGLSVAFELAGRGRAVLIVDRDDVAGTATPAAGGMLAPVAESDIELAGLCEFRRFSHALYPEFVERVQKLSGIDCGFEKAGTLLVAVDRDHREELERLQVIFADQGFPVAWLSAAEVAEREPSLTPRVVCGLSLPQDLCVDTRLLQQALELAVVALGAQVRRGVCVEHVHADGQLDVRQRGAEAVQRIASEEVVVAAGSWSNVGLGGVLAHLPLRPVKGQILRLRAASLLRRVIRTPDIYLIPHRAGHLIVGASVEEQGFDVVPTAGATLDLLRHAWRVLPSLYDAHLEEIAVGFRPTLRDHCPVIGRWQDSHVVAATGHYRNGILQAPGTARVLADLLCKGVEHELMRPFSPNRFALPSAQRPTLQPGPRETAQAAGLHVQGESAT